MRTAEPPQIVDDLEIPTATLPHLLAHDDRRRPQDRVDLEATLQELAPDARPA